MGVAATASGAGCPSARGALLASLVCGPASFFLVTLAGRASAAASVVSGSPEPFAPPRLRSGLGSLRGVSVVALERFWSFGAEPYSDTGPWRLPPPSRRANELRNNARVKQCPHQYGWSPRKQLQRLRCFKPRVCTAKRLLQPFSTLKRAHKLGAKARRRHRKLVNTQVLQYSNGAQNEAHDGSSRDVVPRAAADRDAHAESNERSTHAPARGHVDAKIGAGLRV